MFGCLGARFTQEGQGDLAHGVESRQEGCNRQGDKNQQVTIAKGFGKNFILGPKACRQHRKTRQGKSADQEGPEGDRHLLAQAAHVEHILRVRHARRCAERRVPCHG